MDRWEYKYIDLYRTDDINRPVRNVTDQTVDLYGQVLSDIGQAGEDGWEAVCQITVHAASEKIPTLMLKRRITDEN